MPICSTIRGQPEALHSFGRSAAYLDRGDAVFPKETFDRLLGDRLLSACDGNGGIGRALRASGRPNSAGVQHTSTVQGHLTRVLSLLQDAETGQRGYLLTGKPTYLEPFTSATSDLDKVVEKLGLEVADNASQVQALTTLRLVVNDKLDELLETIELKKANKCRRRLMAAVASNRGKALMDRSRDVLARMLAEEQRLLAVREDFRRSRPTNGPSGELQARY